MNNEKFDLEQIWRDHKWLIILTVAAFLFAVCVISYGFFKTVFLFVCVAAGVVIGCRLDKKAKDGSSEDDFYHGR